MIALERVQEHECLVIDGVSLEALIGSRPVDYALNDRLISAENEELAPLGRLTRMKRKIYQGLIAYTTGR